MEKRSKDEVTVPKGNPVGEHPAAERSPAEGDGAVTRGRWLPRGGRLFGPVFGLLWLAYPIYALLMSDPSPRRRAGTRWFPPPWMPCQT